MPASEVAAILLAAGESTRMGRLKQLLPWAGVTLLERQVAQLREAGADDVVVVLGHEAAAIRDAAPALDARVVVNEAYRDGRAGSLRAGALAIEDESGAVLILSVDQPRPSWVSRLLIERWRATDAPLVIPYFDGHSGHPVLAGGRLLPELRAVSEADLGLRAVVEKYRPEASIVAIDNSAVNVDLNLLTDYEEAYAHFLAGDWHASAAYKDLA